MRISCPLAWCHAAQAGPSVPGFATERPIERMNALFVVLREAETRAGWL